MDDKDLKIQALLERISSLTQGYENIQADYRVLVTKQENEINELKSQVKNLVEASENSAAVEAPKPKK